MSFLWFKSPFEKEEEQTRELYDRVRLKALALYKGNEDFLSDLIADICEDIGNQDLMKSMIEGLLEIAIRDGSFTLENDFPNLSQMNESQRIEYRNRLRHKETVLINSDQNLNL